MEEQKSSNNLSNPSAHSLQRGLIIVALIVHTVITPTSGGTPTVRWSGLLPELLSHWNK